MRRSYPITRERFPGEHYYAYPPFDASGVERLEITTAPHHPERIVPAQLLLEVHAPDDLTLTVQINPEGQRQSSPSLYFGVLLNEMTQAVTPGFRARYAVPIRSIKSGDIPIPPYWKFANPTRASMEINPWNNEPEGVKIQRWLHHLPTLLGPQLESTVFHASASGKDRQPFTLHLEDRTLESIALTDNERTVLSRRYGWDDGIERTLRAIAPELGLSPPRIRQLELSACYKLGSYHRKIISLSKI